MSQRDESRSCPRCARLLLTRESHGGDGLTLVWQCSCGWAAARTVSRDAAFKHTRGLLAASDRADQIPRDQPKGAEDKPRRTQKGLPKLEES
jgi:hypothetical protein